MCEQSPECAQLVNYRRRRWHMHHRVRRADDSLDLWCWNVFPVGNCLWKFKWSWENHQTPMCLFLSIAQVIAWCSIAIGCFYPAALWEGGEGITQLVSSFFRHLKIFTDVERLGGRHKHEQLVLCERLDDWLELKVLELFGNKRLICSQAQANPTQPMGFLPLFAT